MLSILDPRFKYVNSASTDLRKTFARVRREQQKPTGPAQVSTPQVLNLVPRQRMSRTR